MSNIWQEGSFPMKGRINYVLIYHCTKYKCSIPKSSQDSFSF